MADRNLVKFNFHALKNAPRQILTYLESWILKIGSLVQILQVVWETRQFSRLQQMM